MTYQEMAERLPPVAAGDAARAFPSRHQGTLRRPRPMPSRMADRRWKLAMLEVFAAEQIYTALEGSGDADDEALDRAWLRLWNAQRRIDQLLEAG